MNKIITLHGMLKDNKIYGTSIGSFSFYPQGQEVINGFAYANFVLKPKLNKPLLINYIQNGKDS